MECRCTGETCVGIRREDSFYDFDVPDAVAVNVQNPACDAEWTIDVSRLSKRVLPLTGHSAIYFLLLLLILNVINT